MQKTLITIIIIVSLFSSCDSPTTNVALKVDLTDTTLSDQLKKLTEKIKEDPENHEYYYLRSNEWIKQNRLKNALLDISTALEIKNENAVYNFKKAELLMFQDTADANTARKLLEKAVEIEPSFEDAHFTLGKLRLAKQEYEGALSSFDKLIEIDQNNAKAYFWKGIAFKENNFIKKAEEMFFKTIEIDNTYYDGYMQLDEAYEPKDPKIALQFYENALKIKPNSDECMYAMGRIYQNQAKFADAYSFYNQAIQINAGHKFASYAKAYIDTRFENYDKALATLDQIILIAPDYSSAYTLRGYVYEQIKDKALARENYEKALELNPQDSIATKSLNLL